VADLVRRLDELDRSLDMDKIMSMDVDEAHRQTAPP
jgi:hypothetical protein